MKVAVSCQAAIGHFHTVAPLAQALERRGHEVVFVTARGFGAWVAKAGFAVEEVGPDWLATGSSAGRLDDPRRRLRMMSLSTGALIPDFTAFLRAARPDVVVHESLEWAAPLAADAADVPYAALGQLPRLPPALTAEAMSRAWSLARDRLGLREDPTLERLYPYLYLDGYLPSMQPLTHSPLNWLGERAPSVDHVVRPEFYEVGEDEPPPWLDSLGRDRPMAYVTMGTVFNQVPGVFTAVVDAIARRDMAAVVTVGHQGDPNELLVPSPHIRVERYVPQSAVLPHADFVVSHAGYLTVMATLAQGLPTVAIPITVDQPYHAHRLAAAGAAVHVDASTITPDSAGAAIDAVMRDDLYRRNAARLRAEMYSMPPLAHGVDLLEQLVRTGDPVYSDTDSRVAREPAAVGQ
jgi:UDP:flavonoid glycosyltransferase YjiC (YdhE family)